MIKIEELNKYDLGKFVRYDSQFNPGYGKIKSWNEHCIFVVFQCGDDWDKYRDYTGQSVSPLDLTFF